MASSRSWFGRVRARIGRWVSGAAAPSRGASSYEAAATTRLLADFNIAGVRSADQTIRYDHQKLVARARELARNDPYATRFLKLLRTNVVGPHGIRLQARVTRAGGEQDEPINNAIETAFREWAKPQNASVDGRRSLRAICGQILTDLARDGEALVREIEGFDNPFGYALQILDPDQLDVRLNRARDSRGENEIRQGVEIDAWGRPLAYHLWTDHPSDFFAVQRKRIRVPASQVYHFYLPDRAGQTRGVTAFAPVAVDMWMRHGYHESELTASRVASSKMGFYTQDPEAVGDPDQDDGEASIPMEVMPGTFGLLPPGVGFVPWDPNHPNTAFDAFEKAVLRGIAAGLETSYSGLTGDLTDVNYSSMLAGTAPERDAYRGMQQLLVEHFLDRMYPTWVKWALTTGALALPTRNVSRWTDHRWQPRGWPSVDPQKEVNAQLKKIRAGLDSRTRIVAESGRDLEDVFRELAHEKELAVRYGLELSTDTGNADSAPPPGAAGDGSDGEEGGTATIVEVAPRAFLPAQNGHGNGHHPATNGGRR